MVDFARDHPNDFKRFLEFTEAQQDHDDAQEHMVRQLAQRAVDNRGGSPGSGYDTDDSSEMDDDDTVFSDPVASIRQELERRLKLSAEFGATDSELTSYVVGCGLMGRSTMLGERMVCGGRWSL